MAKTIEEQYFEDFGKKEYTAAIHSLWEDHNQYGRLGNVPTWPPTLEQVKKEVEDRDLARAYDNERR